MKEITIYFVMYKSKYEIYPDMAFINPLTALKRIEYKGYSGRESIYEIFDEQGRIIERITVPSEMAKKEKVFIKKGKLMLPKDMNMEDVNIIYFDSDHYIAYINTDAFEKEDCYLCRCKLSIKNVPIDTPIDFDKVFWKTSDYYFEHKDYDFGRVRVKTNGKLPF